MNKPDWFDYTFILDRLFVFKKERKVEKILKSASKKDIYKENVNINTNERELFYYGKKRRSYTDYC
jgi:hypothetical protein